MHYAKLTAKVSVPRSNSHCRSRQKTNMKQMNGEYTLAQSALSTMDEARLLRVNGRNKSIITAMSSVVCMPYTGSHFAIFLD